MKKVFAYIIGGSIVILGMPLIVFALMLAFGMTVRFIIEDAIDLHRCTIKDNFDILAEKIKDAFAELSDLWRDAFEEMGA